MRQSLELAIPSDVAEQARGLRATDPAARMRAVIQWGFANLERGGGPFAAGVFDLETGECLGAGVNRVVDNRCSVAHAEMMALMLAQRQVDSHDLSTYGQVVLTSSAQPCSQCYGALPWSGIRAMEFGAGREAVESIGFDEGPCPDNWRQLLEDRGIQVDGPLLEQEAFRLLTTYRDQGGEIY